MKKYCYCINASKSNEDDKSLRLTETKVWLVPITCSASSLDGRRRRCSSTLFSAFQRDFSAIGQKFELIVESKT